MWLVTNDKSVSADYTGFAVEEYGCWLICGRDSAIILLDDLRGELDIEKFYISKQEVKFQKDYYSCESIYYYQSKDRVYFSNDLRMLFKCSKIPFSINTQTCRRYITMISQIEDLPASDASTFYMNIHKVPPNTVFEFSNGEINQSALRLVSKNTFRTIDDFSVRTVIAEQIRAALPIDLNVNVGIELSGGIDSACVLAELLNVGVNPKRIYAFIMSFEDPELSHTNDLKLAVDLVNHYGIRGYVVQGDASLRELEYAKLNVCKIDGPMVSANYIWLQTVVDMCEKLGIHYIFTGNGGDELLGGSPYIYDCDFVRHPFGMLSKLIQESPRNRVLTRLINLVVKPVFFPWLYYRTLWEERNNPIPAFFTREQRVQEDLARRQCYQRISNSRKHIGRSWGKRFNYDFSSSKPDYLDDFFDGIKFVNPIYSWNMFKLANSVHPRKHFIFSTKGRYNSSKQSLRKEYEGDVPNYILNKEVKTTYNQMSRKMFRNNFARIFSLFSNHDSVVSRIGIIDSERFINELKRVYISSLNPTTQMNLTFRYIWGIIKLEEWLNYIDQGRDFVLNDSLGKQKRIILCEAQRVEDFEF